MSWDRRCMECGGWLTDQAGGLRVCSKCHSRYRFSGGMLIPENEAPKESRASRFGESNTGTFSDRRRGRDGLYDYEVTYRDLDERGEPLPKPTRDTPRSLFEKGETLSAAGMLLEKLGHGLEHELFYPEEPLDHSEDLEFFDEILQVLPFEEAEPLKEELVLKQKRFERAMGRLEADPARYQPFEAQVGQGLGQFLGDRRQGGFGNLPPERSLPLEGGHYALLKACTAKLGIPGGPVRKVSLVPIHFRTRLVTNEEYATFLERTGYPPHPLWGWRGLDLPNRPVVGIRWADAAAYAAHYGGRLPTEAEWCAARATEGLGLRWDDSVYELLLDDAGDPGGPMGSQGVILLGNGLPKALRRADGSRDQLTSAGRRVDVGFRVVLDPRMA